MIRMKTSSNPPYLQVALDCITSEEAMRLTLKLPENENLLIEAGTPLIKAEGISIIQSIRDEKKDVYIIADLKTLDVGALEVGLAKKSTANAATVSGLASNSTIDSFIEACNVQEIDSIVDMMNCDDPVKTLASLKILPVIALLHRGIDMEANTEHAWDKVVQIKETFPDINVAVAGGLLIDNVKPALEAGADIFIVGRAITASGDVQKAANDFLEALKR
ncbi:MAG: orotidine 5'-phosphate decarboxylase / HUMPS family protein [Candidatus Kariarchaeaceae archaeon]